MPPSLVIAWVCRIIAWDGILPVLIWIAPFAVGKLFPNRRGPIELIAIFLPTIACVVRFYVGRSTIRRNFCPQRMRNIQIASLCVGIAILVNLDVVIILRQITPINVNAPPINAIESGIRNAAYLFTIYLLAMAIAMFPGKPSPSADLPVQT